MLCFVGWSDASQSACAGTTQDAHQHGFRLVVEGVGRGDLVHCSLPDQLCKPLMAQFAGSRFKADFSLGGVLRRVSGSRVEIHLKPRGQFFNETLVRIRFSAANLVMKVGHREHNAKLFPQLRQNVKKRNRICAA